MSARSTTNACKEVTIVPDLSGLVLAERLAIMETYLRMKLEQRDWHGVADAAMDIRELEAVLKDRKDRGE